MAHQCLQCGYVFPDGSNQLLAGCPECKGTRFFFTHKPLDEAARKDLASKAQKDLRQVVADLLAAQPEAQKELERAAQDGWAKVRVQDLRKVLAEVAKQQAATDAATQAKLAQWKEGDAAAQAMHRQFEARRAELEKQAMEAQRAPAHPDTVNIRRPGQYDIDVKALLDHEPIVVHKDGTYMIHLPSLFAQAGK